MRKSGFTLIELIFAIVIIGVLAAVAIPQFKNLKQSAEGNNIVKVVKDSETAAPAALVNYYDLEDNSSISLNTVLQITGKGWTTSADGNTSSYSLNGITAIVRLNSGRTLSTGISFSGATDSETKAKISQALYGNKTTTTDYNNTISF